MMTKIALTPAKTLLPILYYLTYTKIYDKNEALNTEDYKNLDKISIGRSFNVRIFN